MNRKNPRPISVRRSRVIGGYKLLRFPQSRRNKERALSAESSLIQQLVASKDRKPVKMAATGKTILVTGGAGYVGSHCVVELLKENYNVIIVDNQMSSDQSDCPESILRVQKITGKTVTYHNADLCNKVQLQKVFATSTDDGKTIDCVIHFAALKAVGESCRLPLKYYGNNITGSANLMEVMMEYSVKKLVFSSSATVYGQPQYLPLDEKHPVGNCTNPYGKTKLFMEEIIKDVCKANSDWGCQLLRYFNPVGSHPSGIIGEDPQGIPNNLMPFIAQTALGKREKLSVFGGDYNTADGTGVRDYVHVMDLAKGHVQAVGKILDPNFTGVKTYNLGTGKGVSVLEMIRAFEEASGARVPYYIVDRRAGDVASCYSSCALAEKELGFRAEKTVMDMCRDTWIWQSNNPNGFNINQQ